jgi:hypothetical protein
MRRLDVVTVKGSEVPIGIFTYDALQDQIFRQDGNRNRPSQGSGIYLCARTVFCVLPAGFLFQLIKPALACCSHSLRTCYRPAISITVLNVPYGRLLTLEMCGRHGDGLQRVHQAARRQRRQREAPHGLPGLPQPDRRGPRPRIAGLHHAQHARQPAQFGRAAAPAGEPRPVRSVCVCVRFVGSVSARFC